MSERLRRARFFGTGLLLALAPVVIRASEEAAGGAHAEEGGGNPLTTFSPGLLIWTVITFVVLVIVLRLVAWPSIMAALKAREEAVRGAIEAAKRERAEAEKLLEEHRALMAQARRDTAAMVEQGRHDAEKVREELLTKARADQQELIAQGRRQIESETRAAIAGMRATTVDLALAASEKLLAKSLDPDTARRLVEETIRDMPARN
jgi:F-type H+-transporting ATPase subunit b